MVEDIVDGLAMVLGLEGSESSYKFVDHDGSGPDIYFLVVASASKHFGSAVIESAGNGEHFEVDTSAPVFLADPVVDEFEAFGVGIVENILGLDISVTDSPRMQVV